MSAHADPKTKAAGLGSEAAFESKLQADYLPNFSAAQAAIEGEDRARAVLASADFDQDALFRELARFLPAGMSDDKLASVRSFARALQKRIEEAAR